MQGRRSRAAPVGPGSFQSINCSQSLWFDPRGTNGTEYPRDTGQEGKKELVWPRSIWRQLEGEDVKPGAVRWCKGAGREHEGRQSTQDVPRQQALAVCT